MEQHRLRSQTQDHYLANGRLVRDGFHRLGALPQMSNEESLNLKILVPVCRMKFVLVNDRTP